MTRLRFDNISSFGSSNPITFANGSTATGSWASAPPFPTIASPDFAVVVVNADTAQEEIAYLTAYTSGATSGTFLRGQEGTTGLAAAASPWHHGPTAADAFPTFVGAGDPNGVQVGDTGQTYQDTTDGGAVWFKVSSAPANTGWVAIPILFGFSDISTTPPGVYWDPTFSNMVLLAPRSAQSVFGDISSLFGLGNGVFWESGAVDGGQSFNIVVGASAEFFVQLGADGLWELSEGLKIDEGGGNAKQGVVTLVAGVLAVANTSVTANSRIFLTVQALGTVAAPKAVAVTSITPGVGFTITSADVTDTSVVAYLINEAG